MDEKGKEMFGGDWPEFTEKLGVDTGDEEYLAARTVNQDKSSPWSDVAVYVAMVSLAIGGGALWWAWNLQNDAKVDRAWIAQASSQEDPWRVAIPPIEKKYFSHEWRTIEVVVNLQTKDHDPNQAAWKELADSIKFEAEEALKAQGVNTKKRLVGSTLLIEFDVDDWELKGIGMALIGWRQDRLIWRHSTGPLKDGVEGWAAPLGKAAKDALAGKVPDGTWDLRVRETSLPSQR